jgi:hypothetical protein
VKRVKNCLKSCDTCGTSTRGWDAQEAGWKRIHTFDTLLTVREGAVGIGPDRDVIAAMDDAEGLWTVNITAESEREPESL